MVVRNSTRCASVHFVSSHAYQKVFIQPRAHSGNITARWNSGSLHSSVPVAWERRSVGPFSRHRPPNPPAAPPRTGFLSPTWVIMENGPPKTPGVDPLRGRIDPLKQHPTHMDTIKLRENHSGLSRRRPTSRVTAGTVSSNPLGFLVVSRRKVIRVLPLQYTFANIASTYCNFCERS